MQKVLSKKIKLSKLKNYMDKPTRVLLYKQTILPLVEYADIMLYHVRKHDLKKLQRLQNKALRICLNIVNPRDITTEDLHDLASLMPLDDRRELHLMNHMHKYKEHGPWLHETVPSTRKAEKINFDTEIPILSVYSDSPYYVRAKIWNDLPSKLQSQETKANFQKAYIEYKRNR